MYEVIQGMFRKQTTAAILWRNDRLLSSCVVLHPADITLYVCVFRGSLKPNAQHTLDIDVDLNVGKIQKVKFLWNNHVINIFPAKLGASQITVQSGQDGTKWVSFIPPNFLYLSINLSMHPFIQIPPHPSMYSFPLWSNYESCCLVICTDKCCLFISVQKIWSDFAVDMFSFPLAMYLGAELLDYVLTLCLTFRRTARLFPIPRSSVWRTLQDLNLRGKPPRGRLGHPWPPTSLPGPKPQAYRRPPGLCKS